MSDLKDKFKLNVTSIENSHIFLIFKNVVKCFLTHSLTLRNQSSVSDDETNNIKQTKTTTLRRCFQ